MINNTNKPIPIRPEIAQFEEYIENLKVQPSISNLLKAINFSFKCGSGLTQVFNNFIPVLNQDPNELITEIKKYRTGDEEWNEIKKYRDLLDISPVIALSELFWKILNNFQTEELWTDGKRILNIDQYTSNINEQEQENTPKSTLSEDERNIIRNLGYQSAVIEESNKKDSNLLYKESLSAGFQHLPWGVFSLNYINQNTELKDGLNNFTKVIDEYFKEEEKIILPLMKSIDKRLFCVIFTCIARRICSHLTKEKLIKIENIEDYLIYQKELNDSNCIYLQTENSELILFDFISTAQNISLICSSLNIDPCKNNLLSNNEFNRIYFEEFPCEKITSAIVCPNIILELGFLPPSAIVSILKNLNNFESKDYDLIDLLKHCQIEGVLIEDYLNELDEIILSKLAYECNDEVLLNDLTFLLNKITKTIKLWNFKIDDIDNLQQHTSHQFLSDELTQKKINIALQSDEASENRKKSLPIKWLNEDPPIFTINDESHPIFTILDFCSSSRCLQSRPDDWIEIAMSFSSYGFKRIACAITALMLISEAKLIQIGDNARINPHKLSNHLNQINSTNSFSMVEYSIDLYLDLTKNKIPQSRYELLIDYYKPKLESKISQILELKINTPKNILSEKYPNSFKLAKISQELLNNTLIQLSNNDAINIFSAQAIIMGAATAVEHELRIRGNNSFSNQDLIQELTFSRIKVTRKNGPDGLKSFANIIRNYDGFEKKSKNLLIGYSPIVNSCKKDTFITLISKLADLSNTRHGNTSDFQENQWLNRIEEVRNILVEEKLIEILCETAK